MELEFLTKPEGAELRKPETFGTPFPGLASGTQVRNGMATFSTETARELLQFHSGRHEDVAHAKWKGGFLGSLRPYTGLNSENFHEVMQCLKTLAPHLQRSPTVERSLIADLFGICHLGRAWGVEQGGMLRSNNLISTQDSALLESWISQISYTTFSLLDGCDVDVAFEGYHASNPSFDGVHHGAR